MEKKDLLKQIGFSDEYIHQLEQFEKEQSFEIDLPFIAEKRNFEQRDSSEFLIENQLKKDSNSLRIK